jgi:hypothetical protein
MLFEEIEQEIIQKDRFVTDQMEKLKDMNENLKTMRDYHKVLQKVAIVLPHINAGQVRQSFHGGINIESESVNTEKMIDHERAPLVGLADDMGVRIAHVAGTIDADEIDKLKRLLFRATRYKALTFFERFTIASNFVGKKVFQSKAVYIVVFQEGR